MTFHGAYSTMFIRRRQVDSRAVSHAEQCNRQRNNGTTYLMASVKKAGTVLFWWKAQCEEQDMSIMIDLPPAMAKKTSARLTGVDLPRECMVYSC